MRKLIDITMKAGKGSVRRTIGTVEIEIVTPGTETADLRERPLKKGGMSVCLPRSATADIPEALPGTDLRGIDIPETGEARSGTGRERTPERDTLEGDKETAREKGGERTLGRGDKTILEIGEGKIQGSEEEMIQEIGERTNPKIGEGKTPGKGTERVLEKEKILMRDNGKTKLIPDERRQRINLWKRETKGWMRMSMINL